MAHIQQPVQVQSAQNAEKINKRYPQINTKIEFVVIKRNRKEVLSGVCNYIGDEKEKMFIFSSSEYYPIESIETWHYV